MSLPPDLRILCQTLTTNSPGELISSCPVLVSQVLHCGGPLSAHLEPKAKDASSESSMLVRRLKLQTNSFLHGKTPSGRFIGIVLVKAIIDIGGWECLRTCEPWVQGLIAILHVSFQRSGEGMLAKTTLETGSSIGKGAVYSDVIQDLYIAPWIPNSGSGDSNSKTHCFCHCVLAAVKDSYFRKTAQSAPESC